MRNVLPNGLTLLQQNPDCAAKLDPTAKDHGWLYTRRAETDWRWVTLRKLSDAEIEKLTAMLYNQRARPVPQ